MVNSTLTNKVISKLDAIPETRYLITYSISNFSPQEFAIDFPSCIPKIWVLNHLITTILQKYMMDHDSNTCNRQIKVISFKYSDTLTSDKYGSRYTEFKSLKVTKCGNTNCFDIDE